MEDHVGIIDRYISRVENGKLEMKKCILKEDLLQNMPIRHDLSKCWRDANFKLGHFSLICTPGLLSFYSPRDSGSSSFPLLASART
jgi:hypothetical protein